MPIKNAAGKYAPLLALGIVAAASGCATQDTSWEIGKLLDNDFRLVLERNFALIVIEKAHPDQIAIGSRHARSELMLANYMPFGAVVRAGRRCKRHLSGLPMNRMGLHTSR